MERKNMAEIDESYFLTHDDLRRKRKAYRSLDEMAKDEGVVEVLKFLSTNPTMVDGHYRHTMMPIVPFELKDQRNIS